MCPKPQNSVIWLRFLALTRTFCGATKRSDRPLVVSLLPHCGDITRVIIRPAWQGRPGLPLRKMSATPTTPEVRTDCFHLL